MRKRQSWPKVTIVIPTFNEEKNIGRCLDSIFCQDYPQDKLEVIVVDDYSQDRTVEIAKKYPVKILFNGAHDGEVGKMIGFQKAQGEFFYYLDADCELRGKNWLKKMVKPLLADSTLVASFTRKYSKKGTPALERYYNFDPLQRDPIYQFFSPSIEETVIEKKKDWWVCQYSLEKIPPAGRCLHRRKTLWPLVKNYQKFLELDFLVILVENGFDRFAYVPQAGLYHHHIRNLADLVKKRLRNVQKVYLPEIEKRRYRWFDLRKPKDVIKIVFWLIYAHLFLPAFLRGIGRAIKHQDWVGLYEPIVTLLVTDVIVFGFLTSAKGRRLIKKGLAGGEGYQTKRAALVFKKKRFKGKGGQAITAWEGKVIGELAGKKRREKILDVGAGTGRISELLYQQFKPARLVCFDASRAMLALAWQKLGKKAEYRVGKAENLPFKNNSFDLVVAFHLLKHLENPLLFLKEARRVLKKNGVLLVDLANKFSLTRFWPGGCHLYSPKELRQWCQKAGLKVAKSKSINFWGETVWLYCPEFLLGFIIKLDKKLCRVLPFWATKIVFKLKKC